MRREPQWRWNPFVKSSMSLMWLVYASKYNVNLTESRCTSESVGSKELLTLALALSLLEFVAAHERNDVVNDMKPRTTAILQHPYW
jgi:hypothetical protein